MEIQYMSSQHIKTSSYENRNSKKSISSIVRLIRKTLGLEFGNQARKFHY